MFKPIPVYIKLRRNHVEITNLNTGETASQQAVSSFSNDRNVVGNFNDAKMCIQAVLGDLGIKRNFWSPSLVVLIQQMEGTEGGLNDIEKRALRDLGEVAGGRKVFLIEDPRPLSVQEALTRLS